MQGTVKYSKEFIMPDGLKVWIGHEIEYDLYTQDPPFEKCALAVHDFAKGPQVKATNGYANLLNPDEQLSTIQVEERQIGTKPEDILSSPDLVVLESYRWLIKGKPELERAYILRHDQLTQKQ